MGRRANKTIAGAATGFLHDGINPVQEQFGGGVNANLLTGGIDQFFSRTDHLGTHTLLTDGLGSTLALSDGSGSILTQYTYEPYGNTSVSGSLYNPFQFTGRENDGTGLYYYRARYYSPTLQRFVSEDPIQLASNTLNFYEYGYDDPINYVDPSGTQAQAIPFCFGGPVPCVIAVTVATILTVATVATVRTPAFQDAARDAGDSLRKPFKRSGGSSRDRGRDRDREGERDQCDRYVYCWLSGEIKDPVVDPKYKLCSYSCTDGKARIKVVHIVLPCPQYYDPYVDVLRLK